MSTWRRRALEIDSSLRDLLSSSDKTCENNIYSLFRELTVKADSYIYAGVWSKVSLIMDFAAWCSRQNDKDLWNAAGVSFYEHIFEGKSMSDKKKLWAMVPNDVRGHIRQLMVFAYGESFEEDLRA